MARREVTVEELGFAETSPAFEAAPRIACAGISEDDPWTAPLTRAFGRSVIATDLERVLDECDRDHPAEVVVIRADGAPGEGLRMLSELRSRTGTRHAAILVVVPPRDTQTAAMALDLGASDIVPDNASAEELAFRIRTQLRRKRKADRLRSSVDDGLRLAMEDPLTGLYNRRYAMANLARLHKSSDRTGRDFGLLLVDIDRFKSINDTRGHAVGDVVLTEVARRLRDNLRGIDMVARIGGEEFLVAMPDIAPVGALAAAQRLCRVVGSDPVRLDNGQPPVAVTISIGLAMYDKSSREPVAALIERADQALYRAKTDGRNQVTVSRTAA